jgi:prepilin-type N-terminal cleavage/methylation domain-containing protein
MSSSLISRVRDARRAFTLIELLTVMAIIGILAGITFGVVKGVQERSAIGQAKSELAAIAQALESYKRQYGDYPQSGTGNALPASTSVSSSDAQYVVFNALAGKLGPKGALIDGRAFVELGKLSLLSSAPLDQPSASGVGAVSNAFIDPWGRLYLYAYKANNLVAAGATAGNWSSYVLYSAGPEGNSGVTISATTGAMTVYNADQAADNIYANK